MARPIILSNGEMAVGLNRFGMVHDLYFPYVGLDNHCSENAPRHRIGLFVDGTMHWLSDGSWDVKPGYLDGRLIGRTIATNHWLGFSVEFQDFVDSGSNVFARNIEIINLTNKYRKVKLFLHQAFVISDSSDSHDTAQYIPATSEASEMILHYKGRRAFAVGGYNPQTGGSFDSFSIGHFGHIDGKNYAGVWRDAEDGNLERNPVARFRTDSVLEFKLDFAAHDSARVNYFLSAGKSIQEARRTLVRFRSEGLLDHLLATDLFWKQWLSPAVAIAEVSIAPEYRSNFLTSLLLMKAMMDRHGAIVASLDSGMLKTNPDTYANCWIRDATYVAMVFWKLGYVDEVKQFLRFAKDVISSTGFFWPSYRSDSAVGPNPHAYVLQGETVMPIQADETAIIVFLLSKIIQRDVQRGGRLEDWRELYESLARPAASFLAGYIDPETRLPCPSYELWEVNYQTTTYTTAATFGALGAAAYIADMFHESNNAIRWREASRGISEQADKFWNNQRNYFYRGFWRHKNSSIELDDVIDISAFYGAWAFELFNNDRIQTAADSILDTFAKTGDVRMPRFENDSYNNIHPGSSSNPWFITSFWMAQYKALNSTAESNNFTKKVLDWANNQMNQSIVLSEQVDIETDVALSAAPLAWSHAEFVNTCLSYGRYNMKEPA